MEEIKLTKQELTDIISVALCNSKDFWRNEYKFIDEQLIAINYTRCC